jgi:mono/diheme cytochrome c family protein
MHTIQLNHDHVLSRLTPVVLAGLLAACDGGDRAPAGGADTAAGAAPATPPAADTPGPGGAQPPGDTPPPTGAAAPGRAGGKGSQQQIALGDSIFHGQVAGATCFVCHGQDAKGTGVGPNLTDAEWLNTDGSLDGIVKTIKSGVPTPKKAPAPMPPMGGTTLTAEQVQAVAAYEYSLSHGGGTN